MKPLIHDNIEFHNVSELVSLGGVPGLCPLRYPQSIREHLSSMGSLHVANAAGVELRFVTSARLFRITLAALELDLEIQIYRGGFGHSDHRIRAGETKTLMLQAMSNLEQVDKQHLQTGPFSPDVWRIGISNGPARYLGIDTGGADIRPPRADEKPSLRWLAYGSSITHAFSKGYIHRAAQRLEIDVLNKGLSGSCRCEEAVGETFARDKNWDIATLELGINMRGDFSEEEFEKCATRLVKNIREGRPEAPVVLITHFANLDHYPRNPDEKSLGGKRQDAYDATLRALANQGDPLIHLIEGRDILPNLDGLGCDLIHPSEIGHLRMGERLAEQLKPLLPGS
jgi:lysophospholipase L1-like esterase